VRDILSNLISNAIRFSPDGETITVRVSRSTDSMVIVITDRGPGIPSEDLPHLFEPFFTVSSELSRHSSGEFRHLTRGMGLGLSVVKRFVEMHGGTVRVETGPAGTSVFVALPLEARGAPEGASATPAKTDGADD
jgi:signal transduction histidine kinase